MSFFIPLTDNDPCPVAGLHKSKSMKDVPDHYLVWLYAQHWLKAKHPDVYDYIVRNAKALDDLLLRKEDRK